MLPWYSVSLHSLSKAESCAADDERAFDTLNTVGTVTYSWTNISTQTIKSSDPLKSERPNDEEGKDLQQHSNEVSGAISTGIDGSFTEGDLRKRIIST